MNEVAVTIPVVREFAVAGPLLKNPVEQQVEEALGQEEQQSCQQVEERVAETDERGCCPKDYSRHVCDLQSSRRTLSEAAYVPAAACAALYASIQRTLHTARNKTSDRIYKNNQFFAHVTISHN